MAATTTPDAIAYPTTTDQVAPFATALATLASSTQTAITNRFGGSAEKVPGLLVASELARNNLYPAPVQGTSVWRTDLGYEQTYYTTAPAGWHRTDWRLETGTVTRVDTSVGVVGSTVTRNGGMVFLEVGIQRPSGIVHNAILATSSIKPSNAMAGGAYSTTSGATGVVSIDTSGQIRFLTQGTPGTAMVGTVFWSV